MALQPASNNRNPIKSLLTALPSMYRLLIVCIWITMANYDNEYRKNILRVQIDFPERARRCEIRRSGKDGNNIPINVSKQIKSSLSG